MRSETSRNRGSPGCAIRCRKAPAASCARTIPSSHCHRINRPISVDLSVGRLIYSSAAAGGLSGRAFDLAELFFVVADAGGDGLEGGAQGGDAGGGPGQGGYAGCLVAVFF